MSIWDSIKYWARVTKATTQKQTKAQATQSPGGGGGWWEWVNSVATGINHFLGGPFSSFVDSTVNTFKGIYDALHKLHDLEVRIGAAILRWVVGYLRQYVNARIAKLRAFIEWQLRTLIRRIAYVLAMLRVWVKVLVKAEAKARRQADIRLDHEIKTRIKWLHQAIEREAVSAYKGQRKEQNAVITGLLDLVINLNPILRPIVSELVRLILDLAFVDDPPARLLIGFVLKHVIDKLGLDKPIGDLLHNLLAHIIGAGKPTDLHGVIADISARLAAGESQWLQFYKDGGSEVEQAGGQWQSITAWTTDALLLALFGTMTLAPEQFARETTNAMAVVVNDTIHAVHALIRRA